VLAFLFVVAFELVLVVVVVVVVVVITAAVKSGSVAAATIEEEEAADSTPLYIPVGEKGEDLAFIGTRIRA